MLSRTPTLCLNNNKSIGGYDQFDSDETNNNHGSDAKLPLHQPQLLTSRSSNERDQGDNVCILLDQILASNMKRVLEINLKQLIINSEIDLEWLKEHTRETSGIFVSKDDLVVAWIFHAKHVYTQSAQSPNQMNKLLNVLSFLLEMFPKCELAWLVYLKCYMEKRNALNDYHEVAMLCMDNLITYDLVWFIISTCPTQYIGLIFERYEKYLLGLSEAEILCQEFEQQDESTPIESSVRRISFFLSEMIFYNVYLKIATEEITLKEGREELEEKCSSARNLFKNYLNRGEIIQKLEPIDLSLLWLCYIYLEAFLCLPSWLYVKKHFYLIDHNRGDRCFWKIRNYKRCFNREFFENVKLIYKNRYSLINENSDVESSSVQILRNYDICILPWKQVLLQQQSNNVKSHVCSLEKLQSLFHEALKSVNACSAQYSKLEIRLFSLPIFLNMINFALVNKKIDTGLKLCERLLKDASSFKELWICFINLQLIGNGSTVTEEMAEKTISSCLETYANDAQIAFLAAQYYKYKVSFGINKIS